VTTPHSFDESILLHLASSGPATAREVAAALLSEFAPNTGNPRRFRRQVNQALHQRLKDRVRQGEDYRWALLQDGYAAERTDESNSTLDGWSRPECLLGVGRLRSGIPPGELVSFLSVGTCALGDSLSELLGDTPPSRHSFLVGDYGEGKSHALELARELALDKGYAVVSVCADKYGVALNHPQRWIPALLNTLECRRLDLHGYGMLLDRILVDPKVYKGFKSMVSRDFMGGRGIDRSVRSVLSRARSYIANPVESELPTLQAYMLVPKHCNSFLSLMSWL
jgi:hypothetical protein